MKQPVTQRKLNINNRKFGYFITQLKIKFCPDISSNRNLSGLVLVAVSYFNYKGFLTLRGATSIYFSLHMKVKCTNIQIARTCKQSFEILNLVLIAYFSCIKISNRLALGL